MNHRRYQRIFLAIFALNELVALLQLGFAYGHYVKHEWWGMGLSLFFLVFNGYLGYLHGYRAYKKAVEHEREVMWRTLITPSQMLR